MLSAILLHLLNALVGHGVDLRGNVVGAIAQVLAAARLAKGGAQRCERLRGAEDAAALDILLNEV